jgi:LysM repeat protein
MREDLGRPRRSEPGSGWWGLLRAWLRRSSRPSGGRYASRSISRSSHHDPDASYGGRGLHDNQAQRRSELAPYILSFVVMIVALGAFLYVGLDWVTGRGRILGLGAIPTPTSRALPIPSPAVVVPTPSPSPVEVRVYVVKAGDTPEQIAREFDVSVNALLQANRISDPRTLQVGQTLRVPPAGTR